MFEIYPISFNKNRKYNKDYKFLCYIIFFIIVFFLILWYTFYKGY